MKQFRSIILCLFLLVGCKNQLQEWQISLNDIQEVTISDYYDNEIELNKEDYTKIIDSYNSIENITLNEEFSDTAIFGKPVYSMNINYGKTNIILEFSELGYIAVWQEDDTYGTYYNVDLYEEFYDVFRNMIYENGMQVNSMIGISSKDYYVQLPFSDTNDYLVGCEMNVSEFYDLINVDYEIDETITLKEYLNEHVDNPKTNDILEIDNITYKLLGVENEEILTTYVRVK